MRTLRIDDRPAKSGSATEPTEPRELLSAGALWTVASARGKGKIGVSSCRFTPYICVGEPVYARCTCTRPARVSQDAAGGVSLAVGIG